MYRIHVLYVNNVDCRNTHLQKLDSISSNEKRRRLWCQREEICYASVTRGQQLSLQAKFL